MATIEQTYLRAELEKRRERLPHGEMGTSRSPCSRAGPYYAGTGPGQDDPNGPAYGMERTCGLSPLSTGIQVNAPAFPPPETQNSQLPNKLTPP